MKESYQPYFTKLDGTADDDIRLFNSLELIDPNEFRHDVFVCGGAQIYEQLLPRCSDLFLTRVKKSYEGDASFPVFEDIFKLVAVLRDSPEFTIEHYRHRSFNE